MSNYIPEAIDGMQSFMEVKQSIQDLAKRFEDHSSTAVNAMKIISMRALLDLYEEYNEMIIAREKKEEYYNE